MNKSLLKHYAKALFEEASSKEKMNEVYDDLCLIQKNLEKEASFASFLDSRQIPLSMKDRIIDEVFQGKIQTISLGFLHIITRKHLTKYLSLMNEDYREMLYHALGIIEGRVYTAYPLSKEALSKLEMIFSEKYKKQVHFKEVNDPRVIAGMKININDTLYDYTIDSQIENIKKKLVYSND